MVQDLLAERMEMSFDNLFDAMADETIIVQEDGTIVAVNQAWRRFCAENGGDTQTHYVGTNYINVCRGARGNSSAEAAIVPEGLNDALVTGNEFRCEYPCDSPTIKRWFELTAARFIRDGRKFLVIQHRNITTRHLEYLDTEQAYIQAETLTALVATTSDAVLSYDLDGRILTWNRAAEKLYGYTAQEALGQSLEFLYPPNWPHSIGYYRDQILLGKLTSFEATRIAKNGTARLVWISCAPVRGPHGDFISVSNIHRDITDVRKAEEARKMIAQEMIHRAKNMLAIVTAIQRQTSKTATSYDEFRTKFGERVQSLLSSTDLLVNSGWTTVSLDELLKTQLRPFDADGAPVTTIDGPALVLTPEAVQAIGMAFHELATNSAKHGAMSMQGGKVAVSWHLTDTGDLTVSWHETGIQCDPPSVERDYGHTVLTNLARTMLDADVEYQIEPTAVLWRLTAGPAFYRIT